MDDSTKQLGDHGTGECAQGNESQPAPSVTSIDEAWLVWNVDHEVWWAPKGCGYTKQLGRAGVFSEAEANELVETSRRFAGRDLYVAQPLHSLLHGMPEGTVMALLLAQVPGSE